MRLHGSITDNLDNAADSARRLRGRHVYADTLAYWRNLLLEAQKQLKDQSFSGSKQLEAAIGRLEVELAERSAQPQIGAAAIVAISD